jgi:hypothetical protein
VRIGNLNEVESAHVLLHLACTQGGSGNENGTANPGKLEKVTPVHLVNHL